MRYFESHQSTHVVLGADLVARFGGGGGSKSFSSSSSSSGTSMTSSLSDSYEIANQLPVDFEGV